MLNSDYNLWEAITSRRPVTRKKIKFSSLRPGRRFWKSSRGGVAATKIAKRTSPVPSGYTNARDGNIFFYVDPNSHVWAD